MSAPLYEMLVNYGNSRPIPFHMPGHLLGKGLPDILREAGRLDITEIPGADCLHYPDGAILEAQDLAAGLFGAGKTFFLVNGSTVGIHAMIRAAVRPGGRMLIGRDSHRSVVNALAMLDVNPVFVMPEYDAGNHMTSGYSAESIKNILERHADVQAVLLTRPNYYGAAARLEPIVEITKARGIPLLIDEAHGAHFIFHECLPKPSLEAGADACVQSMHKTLPALTQTALLHVGRNSRLDAGKVGEQLSLLQTTSPSYILMASMDIAREVMEKEGKALYQKLYNRIEQFSGELEKIPGVSRVIPTGKDIETDFSRIVLSFDESGMSGFEAESVLRTSSGLYSEMADSSHVVLIATPYHTERDFAGLLNGIKAATRTKKEKKRPEMIRKHPDALPRKILDPGAAMRMEKEWIRLEQAEGRISGECITPYPPGIPLVYPGEAITRDLIEYATEILGSGGSVHGIMDGRVRVVR